MKKRYCLLALIILCTISTSAYSQVELLTPGYSGNDTVWYKNIDENNIPEPSSCQSGQTRYFRYKYSKTELIEFDYKRDTIKTKKEDWNKKDEEEFDEEYNKLKKDELDELLKNWDDDREDLSHLTTDAITEFFDKHLNNSEYCICIIDCPSQVQVCKIYWDITQLKDAIVAYKYKTSSSWLEEKDPGPNEVELEFDLYLHYDAWIYFKIKCSCDESYVLADVDPSPDPVVNAFWSTTSLTTELMKPGYPFVPTTTNGFPWLLTGAAGITVGGVIYFATSGDETNADCNFTVTTNQLPTHCSNADGSASVTVVPSGDYKYLWSNGATTSSIQNVTSGTYSVTITDSAGNCPKVVSIIIENVVDIFNGIISTTDSDCGLNNGNASVEISPSGTYNIQWSNGQSGSAISEVSPGQYSLTITSPNGCAKISSFIIGEDSDYIGLSFDVQDASCGIANGSAMLVIDPPGDYSIEWSNGEETQHIQDLTVGDYSVTIIPANSNCVLEGEITVEELPLEVTLEFITEPEYCGQSNGAIQVLVTPEGKYNYAWSNGGIDSAIDGLTVGNYSVTVSIPGTECVQSAEVSVTASMSEFNISVSTESSHCGLNDGSATVIPDQIGSYTYLWSNGSVLHSITGVTSGAYSVTVVDSNGCERIAQVTISEIPIQFIEGIMILPGNCTGGGEINLDITNPTGGNLIVDVNGPNGKWLGMLTTGIYNLSTFFPIASGVYTIVIYDEEIGFNCSQSVAVDVMDNTPLLVAMDDAYVAEGTSPVEANVLENDEGLNLSLINVFDIIGGTVSFDSDGHFTFVADPEFSGEASFNYSVVDACGTTDNAHVTIMVSQVICDYNVNFTYVRPSCGWNDGSIQAFVNIPGNYTFVWSNGSIGNVLMNVVAGNYTVTVSDSDSGCSLDFQATLTQNPTNYISNLTVSPSGCSMSGEIEFTLSSPGNGPMEIIVNHPNGIFVITTNEGPVVLSDYLPIVVGDYFLSVTDQSIGLDCMDNRVVTVTGTNGVNIMLENIFHPSGMTSMDGAVEISVITPGQTPYFIILSGDTWGTTSESQIFIEGLSAGDYTIQLIDANGCSSNVLFVSLVPPTEFVIGLSHGLFPIRSQNVEELNDNDKWQSGDVLQFVLTKPLASIPHSLEFSVFNGDNSYGFVFGQYATLLTYDNPTVKWNMDMGYRIETIPDVWIQGSVLIKSTLSYQWNKKMYTSATWMQGNNWSNPYMQLNVNIPLK